MNGLNPGLLIVWLVKIEDPLLRLAECHLYFEEHSLSLIGLDCLRGQRHSKCGD